MRTVRTLLRRRILSVGVVLAVSITLSAVPAEGTAPIHARSQAASRGTRRSRVVAPVAVPSHFAVQSFGSRPTVPSESQFPEYYDPLSSLSESHLPGDRQVGSTSLGPTALFPALGNDLGIGDCTVVAAASVVAAADVRLKIDRSSPTTAQAVAEWHILNVDTATGITDARLLNAWRSASGLLGSRIAGWTSLDIASRAQIKAAIMATGGLYARLTISDALPWSALVWSHIPSSTAAVEGHAVALVGWTRSGLLAASWGEVVLIPWAYWSSEGSSAYAVSLEQAE